MCTKTTQTKGLIAAAFIVLLLIIDQVIKFEVKLHMSIGERIHVTDWFYILFTENPGMAFGWEFLNKTFLSIFRIIASGAILWIITRLCRDARYSIGFLLSICAILAGAVGNIIDSIFYGVIFDHSYGQVATLFPAKGGYASWLHGRVVDMFYFPLIEGTFPSWLPIWGGEEFIFFRPIFNFADACISVGLVVLILFYSKSFAQLLGNDHKTQEVQEQDHGKKA